MAEPFGLFEFLQSFLGKNPLSPPDTQENPTIENPQKTMQTPTPAATENSAENNAEYSAESTAETASNTSNHQAIVQFMQTHEQRAKRIKKT